jgi:hypothetical protein
MLVKWFRQIDFATSPADVMAVARDFVAAWEPADLALLPPSCRPGKLRGEADITELHSCLVEEYRTSQATGESLKRLQEMTSFVVRAAIRLAELTPDADVKPEGTGTPGNGPRSAAPPEH